MLDPSFGKLAILVGGGPAPGINGVIASATIDAINYGVEVIGFRDGYQWLAKKDIDWSDPRCPYCKRLAIDDVSPIALRGGSYLGTSRYNPTKKPEDMERVLGVFKQMGIRSLVSIGGDDTAFSASQLCKQAGGSLLVAHVPKTIDNDLPLPESTPTFGFETARHVGTYVVRNLAEDAKTTSRWYLIISMGRAAGFLALGIGKAAAATLTLIPEEFPPIPDEVPRRKLTLEHMTDLIIGSIIKRRAQGRHYGVVVLAEGLIEAIGSQRLQETMGNDLSRYGKLVLDPHNHLRLGEIEFGRMVKDFLSNRLEQMGLKDITTIIDKDLGYELRCADPVPFDAEYVRDLGYGAVKFLRSPEAQSYGAIISFVAGHLNPLRFDDMINPKTGRMLPRKVDIEGEVYQCARRYMIRLIRRDFEDVEQLARLAAAARMTPEQFRERFGYLVS